MNFNTVRYTHNSHYINFGFDRQENCSLIVSLFKGTELTFNNFGWAIDYKTIRLVLAILSRPNPKPSFGIRVGHNFNLLDNDLYLVPFDENLPHTDWKMLEELSAQNDRGNEPHVFRPLATREEPSWQSNPSGYKPAWPPAREEWIFNGALPEVHEDGLEEAAAAIAYPDVSGANPVAAAHLAAASAGLQVAIPRAGAQYAPR